MVIECDESCIDATGLPQTIEAQILAAPNGAVCDPAPDLRTMLAEENGNIAATARRLGISRTTVYNRMRREDHEQESTL